MPSVINIAVLVESMAPSRMLKKSASSVLTSFRPSTGNRPPHHSAARTNLVLLIRRTVRPRGYASGFDSPAALLDGLFEHPAWFSPLFSLDSSRIGTQNEPPQDLTLAETCGNVECPCFPAIQSYKRLSHLAQDELRDLK
jgi:hypothetical protein